MYFKAESIAEAYEHTLRHIVLHGEVLMTEDLERTLESKVPVTLHIADPTTGDRISKFSPLQKTFMDEYASNIIYGSDSNFDYTYYDRMTKFEMGDIVVDQVQNVYDKLRSSPYTRRGVIGLWDQETDMNSKNPPCLNHLQFLERSGKLNMSVVFRSNDMLMAAGSNMYGLVMFQEYMANLLELEVGWYEHKSISAHIYYERDYDSLEKFIDGKYLSYKCSRMENEFGEYYNEQLRAKTQR